MKKDDLEFIHGVKEMLESVYDGNFEYEDLADMIDRMDDFIVLLEEFVENFEYIKGLGC